MKEITELAVEIKRLSETTNPVIYDLSDKLIHLLEIGEFYCKKDVVKMIERTDIDIPDYDQESN